MRFTWSAGTRVTPYVIAAVVLRKRLTTTSVSVRVTAPRRGAPFLRTTRSAPAGDATTRARSAAAARANGRAARGGFTRQGRRGPGSARGRRARAGTAAAPAAP